MLDVPSLSVTPIGTRVNFTCSQEESLSLAPRELTVRAILVRRRRRMVSGAVVLREERPGFRFGPQRVQFWNS